MPSAASCTAACPPSRLGASPGGASWRTGGGAGDCSGIAATATDGAAGAAAEAATFCTGEAAAGASTAGAACGAAACRAASSCAAASFSACGAGTSGGGARLSLPSAAPERMASFCPSTCMPPALAGLLRSGRLSACTTGTSVPRCPVSFQAAPSSSRSAKMPPPIVASRFVPASTASRGRPMR